MKSLLPILFLLITSLTLNSCISNIEDVTSGNPIDPNEISYSEDIQPIFNSTCGGSGCHIDRSTSGVNLTSYNTVMNSVGSQYGSNIVLPGEPNESPIVDKIEPNPENGNRMPSGGPYLTADEINKIKAWIEGGAEDN